MVLPESLLKMRRYAGMWVNISPVFSTSALAWQPAVCSGMCGWPWLQSTDSAFDLKSESRLPRFEEESCSSSFLHTSAFLGCSPGSASFLPVLILSQKGHLQFHNQRYGKLSQGSWEVPHSSSSLLLLHMEHHWWSLLIIHVKYAHLFCMNPWG